MNLILFQLEEVCGKVGLFFLLSSFFVLINLCWSNKDFNNCELSEKISSDGFLWWMLLGVERAKRKGRERKGREGKGPPPS